MSVFQSNVNHDQDAVIRAKEFEIELLIKEKETLIQESSKMDDKLEDYRCPVCWEDYRSVSTLI